VTVCKQFNVYNNSGPNAANPLGAFESQWAADAPLSSQLASDVADYLSLMESGGVGSRQRRAESNGAGSREYRKLLRFH
jgi:hypothetical protein